jgi:hypothetical protein
MHPLVPPYVSWNAAGGAKGSQFIFRACKRRGAKPTA